MSILKNIKRQVGLTMLTLLALVGLKESKVQTARRMSRSKYEPHQNQREKTRRIRQGLTR